MGSVRWSVGCNVTIQSGSVDRARRPRLGWETSGGKGIERRVFPAVRRLPGINGHALDSGLASQPPGLHTGPKKATLTFSSSVVWETRRCCTYLPTTGSLLLSLPPSVRFAAHLSSRYLLLPPIAPSNRIESNSFWHRCRHQRPETPPIHSPRHALSCSMYHTF